jgi:hypothetical protein
MGRVEHSSDAAVLRSRFSQFLGSRSKFRAPLLSTIRQLTQRKLNAVIFGGTVRDLMVQGQAARPRDVDIVVDGASTGDLEKIFHRFLVRKTRFGGLHLNVQGWNVDVWPLAETWALKNLSIANRDFEALTRTTFLNVEAAVIGLSTERGVRPVHAHGFFEGMKDRQLDINLEENPFPELATVRTLITAHKLNYSLSKRLARYVVHYTHKTPTEQLVHVQFAHYGSARFGRDVLHNWARVVRTQVASQPVIRIPIFKPAQMLLWPSEKSQT